MPRIEIDYRLARRGGFAMDAAFTSEATVTALIGPSGSGKSSVLAVIAGLEVPKVARVIVNDRVFVDTDARIKLTPEARRVGYVVQDYLLFPHMTVEANLRYGRDRRPPGARDVAFDRVVKELELTELLKRPPRSLSGGQQQRVALGRALLSGPEILLLDEPLAALDRALRRKVLTFLESLLAEWQVPVVYVTHSAEEAARLAGWVVRLEEGRVVAQGTPDEVGVE